MQQRWVDLPEVEYIEGRAYPKVSPKRTHGVVQHAVGAILERCAKGRGTIAPEWRFRLAADTSFVPDTAFVSYERLRKLSHKETEEPPFAPDIAVEVRSPSDRQSIIDEKTRWYLKCGALLVLNIDPRKRNLVADDGASTTIFREGDRFSHAAVPWLEFDVAELFAHIDIPPA